MRSHRLVLSLALLSFVACKKDPAPVTTAAPVPEAPAPTAAPGFPPAEGVSPADVPGPATADDVERNPDREKALSEVVSTLLEERHVLRRKPDDAISAKAFDELIERMDPGRLFLLQEHVDQLKRSASLLDDQLAAGKLDLAIEAGRLLRQRFGVIKAAVDAHLARPLDLSNEELLEVDGEKRAFCRTEEELSDRWRQVLENSLLSRIESMTEADEAARKVNTPIQDADRPPRLEPVEARAQDKLKETYDSRFDRLQQQTQLDWMESFVNAIASAYDPHTTWMPPKEKEDFDIRMTGRLEGIGAVLSVDGYFIKVVRIVPGSASWRQGKLKADDHILAVGQGAEESVDVVGMRLSDAVQMIRGPKGTEVRLTVRKPDGSSEIIPIVRDIVRIETTYARGAVLNHPSVPLRIGYIDVPSFYGDRQGGGMERTSSGDVERLLRALQAVEVDAVVLDLRSNGGGFLEDARHMAGLFIGEGPVVQTRSFSGHTEALRDDDPAVVWDGPLICMVNRFSASASEIVAGALQDYGRALIVGLGEATHGKGTVQTLVNLNRLVPDDLVKRPGVLPLGVMKITQQQYYRISGGSTQLKGILPDLVLPDPVAHLQTGERSYDTALPWDELPALAFEVWKKPGWSLDTLRERSDERVAKEPAFDRVRRRVALLGRRQDQTVWPLQRPAWEARQKAQQQELEALDEPEDAPSRFTATVVRYAEANEPLEPGDGDDKDPLVEWTDNLQRDAWVEETLRVLSDMKPGK